MTSLSRRGVLAAGLGIGLAGCGSTSGRPSGSRRIRYGEDPAQHVDLRHPARGAKDRELTVVLLHGGYWRPGYGADLMEPLVTHLTGLGCTTWNVEYRRVGEGGGVPTTLEDVAAAVDALAGRDVPRETVLLGHSAGGHLAVWAASRTSATPGGAPKATPARVVSLAGVLDLTAAARQSASSAPVTAFVGGTPDGVPALYRVADPALLVPAACPVLAVRAADDRVVDPTQAPSYVARATAAGGDATLVDVPGDHFTPIDPRSEASPRITRLVLDGAAGGAALPR